MLNALSKVLRNIIRGTELSGMKKAAHELRSQGYFKEADKICQDIRKG